MSLSSFVWEVPLTLPLLEASSLTKHYRQRRLWKGKEIKVLEGVDLQIFPAQIHAILGLNGAGKTTLLRLALGLHAPTSGTIRLWGMDPFRSSAWKHRVGYLPEQGGFPFSTQPVWEFLREQAQRKRISSSHLDQEVDRVIALCRIQAFEDCLCGSNLSYGQRRRVFLAQSLLGKPELLFLDEPFNGLEIPQMIELCEIFRDLREQGISIFLSSHLLSMLERIADRVTILRQGKIEGSRTPSEWIASSPLLSCRFQTQEPLPEALIRDWGLRQDGDLWSVTALSRPLPTLLAEILPYQPSFWSSRPSLEDIFLHLHHIPKRLAPSTAISSI
jgi:ABC-2 type transport system ATP-binding protein